MNYILYFILQKIFNTKLKDMIPQQTLLNSQNDSVLANPIIHLPSLVLIPADSTAM